MANWKRWVGLAMVALFGVPTLLCAATGIAGMALPEGIELSVEETLDAPRARVHDHLDDAEGIAAWWSVAMEVYAQENGSDPGMEVVHVAGSPAAGEGCQVEFQAGGMTAETWTILSVGPDAVVYEVDFAGMMTVERTLTLTPAGEGTHVVWAETGTIGNPWVRLMASAMGTEETQENFRGALQALESASKP